MCHRSVVLNGRRLPAGVLDDRVDRRVVERQQVERFPVVAPAVGVVVVERFLRLDVRHRRRCRPAAARRSRSSGCSTPCLVRPARRTAPMNAAKGRPWIASGNACGSGGITPSARIRTHLVRRAGRVVAVQPDGSPHVVALGVVEHEDELHLRPDRMQPVLERGDDAEIAAAAAQAPQQLGVLRSLDTDHLARRGYQLGADQVVAGQAVLAAQVAEAAAERQAGDAGIREHTARRGQPVHLRRRVQLAPGRAAAGACYAVDRVDLDGVQIGEDRSPARRRRCRGRRRCARRRAPPAPARVRERS